MGEGLGTLRWVWRIGILFVGGCSTQGASTGATRAEGTDASVRSDAATAGECSFSCDGCPNLTEATTCTGASTGLFPQSGLLRSTGCGLVGLTEVFINDCPLGTSYYDPASGEQVGLLKDCDGWYGEPKCGPRGQSFGEACSDIVQDACTVCGHSACELQSCLTEMYRCDQDEACHALWTCALDGDCRDASCFGAGPCKTGTAYDDVPDSGTWWRPAATPNPVSLAQDLATCLSQCDDQCPGRFGAR